MGEIEFSCDYEPIAGFYGSFVVPGDPREGQWMFRVALVQAAPDVIFKLIRLKQVYERWLATRDPEFWMPIGRNIALLSAPGLKLAPEERDFLEAIQGWAQEHHIDFEWIWQYACYVVAYWSRYGLDDGSNALLFLNVFASSDNGHGVPDTGSLGEVRVEGGTWDPQMQTFQEFQARQTLELTALFRERLRARFREYRKEVEQQMLAIGYVKRPARRQGGDPFRPYRWLVEHLVLGRSMTEIAAMAEPRPSDSKARDGEGLSRSTIEKGIARAAKECGIELPGKRRVRK